ncbi:hypothetical protein VP01_3924g3 [Puccinia sorghi]|uniref:Uncharacterized protein n=1 Tax=Puccinia sorghi TaxID=27349 RepID=A0A0L6USI8_9BASI|nr:hypothetical protein VP01_3924g3 [Puccinia sorghi]
MTGNQLGDLSKNNIQHQKLCVNSIEEASESIHQLSDQREGEKVMGLQKSVLLGKK